MTRVNDLPALEDNHEEDYMLRKLTTVMAVTVVLRSAAACADDFSLSDMFQFHSYGTLGATYSDLKTADYISTNTQPQGAGYTRSVSPDVDSKVAVQMDAKFTSRLSAIIQLISESDDNSSWTHSTNPRYRPSLEWANLKFQATDDISVRAGRTVLPMNLISEYRNVGYANHFVYPPIESYSVVPFTNNDGGDITYHKQIGRVTNTFVLFGGGSALREPTLALESHQYGFSDTLEVESLRVHAAYMYTPIKVTSFPVPSSLYTDFIAAANALPDNIGSAAAVAALDLYNRYDFVHSWILINHYDLGAIYDPGKWFVMGEVYLDYNDGFLGDEYTGWVSGGYRYGNLTPYATYSRARTVHRNESGIPLAGLPGALAAYGAAINGTIGVVQQIVNPNQQSFSAGVRWDFMKNLDLKVQYDRVGVFHGSNGEFTNVQSGFQSGSNANVINVVVDFVF